MFEAQRNRRQVDNPSVSQPLHEQPATAMYAGHPGGLVVTLECC